VIDARGAIENALARYGWAYDKDELELIGECFTSDAEVEFSTGWQVGRSAIVEELGRRRAKYRPIGAVPWHVITNVFVREQTDEEAQVVSFYTFYVKEPGAAPVLQSIGHYADLFAPEDGTWRIRRRSVVPAAAPGERG
jgi:hypothetical protein